MLLRRQSIFVGWKDKVKLLLVGAVVAAHWLCFFEGIEVANVSTCLAGLASTTLFVALFEPLFFKRAIRWLELAFSIIVIVGLLCISWELPDGHIFGFLLGILGALLAALFGTINGVLIKRMDANIITLWEMLGGIVATSIYFYHYE